MSEQRTSFSSRIIKRRDPNRAIVPVIILWLLAALMGLFVPEAWGTGAVIIGGLLNKAVIGAVIFLFAQERKNWKGIAVLCFVASTMLEALFFIRTNCGFSVFIIGAPARPIQNLLSDSAMLLRFINTIFYQFVFGFALVVSSLLRFSGRTRWWTIVFASSASILACSVINVVPLFIAGEQQAAVHAALLVELWMSLLCAAAVCSAAILFDWLCSFSARVLYLNRGASFWCIVCAVGCAAAIGVAAASLPQATSGIETLLFALTCATAYVLLLVGKREGMAVLVFAFVFTILVALTRTAQNGVDILTFAALAAGSFIPTTTWLILANSWQNTAPPLKKIKEKKPAPMQATARVSLSNVAAASGTVSATVPIPASAGTQKLAPVVSVDMTQAIPIVTQMPPQASSKELKQLAKQQMAMQQAVWKQQQQQAVLREKEALRQQKEQQAQQKEQEKQKLRDQKEQEKRKQQQMREQQAQDKLRKEQELLKSREDAENQKQLQKQQKLMEKQQQKQAEKGKNEAEQTENEPQEKKNAKAKPTQAQALPQEVSYPEGFCDQCGKPLEAGSRFCMMCGLQREPLTEEIGKAFAAVATGAANTAPAQLEIAVQKQQKKEPIAVKRLEKPQQKANVVVSAGQANTMQSPKEPKADTKVYMRSDNCGTMHKNVGQATSYWVMRRPTMTNKPPFLLYTFKDEAPARDALLSLSFIHTAVDTGEMICDFLMEYGYYALFMDESEPQCFEAVVCGHDLTPQRFAEAKSIFASHGGQLKSEQAPFEEVVQAKQKADVSAVAFKEEFVDNGKYRYRVFYAPNRACAIEFLRQNVVDEEFFYLMVDTPAGSFGRDIDGMYEI